MSTDFKCNDGNEHDFDSNTESEYCAKGCGEKWAIYAIKKLGADLKEKDAEIEQLKDENEKVYDALAGNICGYCWQKMEEEPTAKRTHQDHVNELLAEITALKSKLKIAKETLINIKSWGYKTQWEIIDKAMSEIGEI